MRMTLVPDHSPQARARAAHHWAQYPNAHDGVSLPPLVPDAVELLKARINFDLTGRSAEKRLGLAALALTVAVLAYTLQEGSLGVTAVVWVVVLALLGVAFVANRRRNAGFAARLRAAGFVPVTDAGGRVRYLPATGSPYGTAPPHPGTPAQPPHAPQQNPYWQPQQPPR
ncbi:hypothetical protein ACGFZL_21020 [Streptomyces sp. NPDC048182]|uniref:hypothetical protein n=1 Tax=Streptomyces sp. NPDC048182 TaxID=3365507 RepID=UPI0037154CDF